MRTYRGLQELQIGLWFEQRARNPRLVEEYSQIVQGAKHSHCAPSIRLEVVKNKLKILVDTIVCLRNIEFFRSV